MLEIIFIDNKTDRVTYAIIDVRLVRYITPSEIGFTDRNSRNRSCAFPHTERIEIAHNNNMPLREVLHHAV